MDCLTRHCWTLVLLRCQRSLYWERQQIFLESFFDLYLFQHIIVYPFLFQTFEYDLPLLLSVVVVISVLSTVFTLLYFLEVVFERFSTPVSCFVWLSMLSIVYFLTFLKSTFSPMDNAPQIFFVIFTTHTMMSFEEIPAVVLGVLTALSQLLTSAFLANANQDNLTYQVRMDSEINVTSVCVCHFLWTPSMNFVWK